MADATALFFAAPLFITVLLVPFLGEKVSIRRLAAVLVGFLGVLIMLRPGGAAPEQAPDRVRMLWPRMASRSK